STTFLTTTRQQGSFTYSPPVTSTTATSSPAVSSTITAIPPGLAVETLSGTYTTNGWTTTTINNQSTVLPIIAEGHGLGVIIWGLPPFPFVDFLFKIPNLPKFYFPCIPLFGSCNEPPVTDGPPTPPENSPDNPTTGSPDNPTTGSPDNPT